MWFTKNYDLVVQLARSQKVPDVLKLKGNIKDYYTIASAG
jgi:hypothetical protein